MTYDEGKWKRQARSDKKNVRRYYLKFTNSTDIDIIKHLDGLENKQGYIKKLIRNDMAPENTPGRFTAYQTALEYFRGRESAWKDLQKKANSGEPMSRDELEKYASQMRLEEEKNIKKINDE